MASEATTHVASKIVDAIGRDVLKHKAFGRTLVTVILDEQAAKAFLVEHFGSEYWRPTREAAKAAEERE
jgi:hypothetical protein